MGKDVRGIERGKCACGECEDFVRSDGATCVAVCRLAILKRMPATPLTLLVAHQLREQVTAQVQRSGKMKTWGGSRTQRANILNFQIVFCEKFYRFFWTNCPYKERFCYCSMTERKRQWEVREALKAINHRTPRGNIKIWAKADTGRERQLC